MILYKVRCAQYKHLRVESVKWSCAFFLSRLISVNYVLILPCLFVHWSLKVLRIKKAFKHKILIRIYIYIYGLAVRVFANDPGDLGSIPGHTKDSKKKKKKKEKKKVLDASLLNTEHYKVRIKGKVEQSREGVAPSPTHWCSSYRKGSLRVTLDYGRQLFFIIVLVVTKSLCGFVAKQVQYNMENAQYLG